MDYLKILTGIDDCKYLFFMIKKFYSKGIILFNKIEEMLEKFRYLVYCNKVYSCHITLKQYQIMEHRYEGYYKMYNKLCSLLVLMHSDCDKNTSIRDYKMIRYYFIKFSNIQWSIPFILRHQFSDEKYSTFRLETCLQFLSYSE